MGKANSGESKPATRADSRTDLDAMIPDKKYRNPPVVEALCELYFAGSQWSSTTPGLFFEKIKTEYPETRELQQMEARVNIAPSAHSAQFQKLGTRTQFIHREKTRLVQLEQNLLVVNQLQPYPRFTVWQPTIRTMLGHYAELAHPSSIDRIGLRYINKIHLPPIPLRMRDYFRIYPEIPPEMAGTHGRFMLRVDVRPHHNDHELIITFALDAVKHNEPISVLFDLYDMKPIPGPFSLDAVAGVVKEAHENIVLVFENSITEKTRAIFEG